MVNVPWCHFCNNPEGLCKCPPVVLNKRRDHIPADAVYIGRGSPWGNPFKIGPDGTRDEVCDRFEREVLPALDLEPLRDKALVCFCAPQRCHGDSILRALRSIQSPPKGDVS